MFRVGVRFERLFAQDRKALSALLDKIQRQQARLQRPFPRGEPPRAPSNDEHRRDKRVVLSSKGDMVAFITPLEEGAIKPPPDPNVVAKKTGELATYNVIDISLEGCSFTAHRLELFKPLTRLLMKIVGEGLMLDVRARVSHVVRLPH